MLDARQLGLKLIANVTYGYTSAHFSGRMPCVEVRHVKIEILAEIKQKRGREGGWERGRAGGKEGRREQGSKGSKD